MTTEQRLERLERENRWMRRIGAVGVAVAAAVFLIGQGKDKPGVRTRVIEAPGVVVRDADNKARIRIGLYNKEPAIRMFGPAGKKRLSIELDPDGTPNLFMFDTEGTARAEFVMDSAGTCALSLHDETGQARADLTVYADGTPKLALFNAKGKVIWKAP